MKFHAFSVQPSGCTGYLISNSFQLILMTCMTGKFAFAALGCITLIFFSCQKGETPIGTVDCSTVTYSGTISPLVATYCGGSGCHGANGHNGPMVTYNNLKAYVDNGAFKREVLTRQTMPEGGSLSSSQLGQIKCWLDSGAPDN